jgi:dTDP-4-dehydrorhamnose reductase
MDKPVVLVTGANGQVGSEMRALAGDHPDLRFVFLSRSDMPIDQVEGMRRVFDAVRPAWCVNCAAYTAVDRAETEQDMAYLVNAEAPGLLAALCHERQVRFLHLSTDYVFDGSGRTPYKEEDAPGTINVYGASKLAGELQVRKLNEDAVIVRTSWVYSEFGRNFVKTMLNLMKDRELVKVVNDQWGSPTYAADLAEAIMGIVKSDTWAPGIFHFCNEGVITWYELACAIRDLSGSGCRVEPIPTKEFPTPAARPSYSVLDTRKIREVYGIAVRPWKESLRRCLSRLGEKK